MKVMTDRAQSSASSIPITCKDNVLAVPRPKLQRQLLRAILPGRLGNLHSL